MTGEPPQPVASASVEAAYQSEKARFRTDAEGRFSGERGLHRAVLYARSPDGKLAGITEIEPDAKEATIRIAPTASIRGRVLDESTRTPLTNTRNHWARAVSAGLSVRFGGDTVTGDDGSFEAAGLVVGQEYHVSVPLYRKRVLTFTPKAAGEENVGDLTARNPDGPTVAERYDTAVKESPLFHQHVLVVFFERDQPVTLNWFKLSLVDRKVRTELYNFKLLNVDAKAAGAAALAEKLGVDVTAQKLPAWAIRDADGHVLEHGKMPVDADDGLVDRTAVLEKLKHFAPERLDASQLLQEALTDAAKTNRRVIVQETATWCGPCHLLALYLDAHRNLWEKDYIWIRMDQRWTGCDEVMDKFQEKRGGIPWCAILDAEGKTLATTDGPKGNIGFPSSEAGIDHFMQMLQSTKQRLTEEDLAALRKDLEKR